MVDTSVAFCRSVSGSSSSWSEPVSWEYSQILERHPESKAYLASRTFATSSFTVTQPGHVCALSTSSSCTRRVSIWLRPLALQEKIVGPVHGLWFHAHLLWRSVEWEKMHFISRNGVKWRRRWLLVWVCRCYSHFRHGILGWANTLRLAMAWSQRCNGFGQTQEMIASIDEAQLFFALKQGEKEA